MRLRSLFILAALSGTVLSAEGWAQAPSYGTAGRTSISVSTLSLYQQYTDDDRRLEEMSVPLSVSARVDEAFSFGLYATQAFAGGENLSGVSGLSDTYLSMGYVREVGPGSLAFTLGANLPSGKQKLTPGEFQTTVLLSQQFYDFRTTAFGQGLTLTPALTGAFPINDLMVVGLGASYQWKDGYRPLEAMEADYEPGNELTFTLGSDFRINPISTLSWDVRYTVYQADEMFGDEIYQAGDKAVITALYRFYPGFDELRIHAHYRTTAPSQLPVTQEAPIAEELRTIPRHAQLAASYRRKVSDLVSVQGLLMVRWFGETEGFSSKQLLDIGVSPAFVISQEVQVLARAAYTLGSFSGIEAGIGLHLTF